MDILDNWKAAPGDLVNLDEIKDQIAANFASKPLSNKRKQSTKASPKGASLITSGKNLLTFSYRSFSVDFSYNVSTKLTPSGQREASRSQSRSPRMGRRQKRTWNSGRV